MCGCMKPEVWMRLPEVIAAAGRPVGWSGDGGVRESNKVELIKSGGGSRRGLRPLSPS